jgi:chromosomal replication initiator protein
MLAMWLARKHTRAALTEISEFFGRRSHSTVVSAQNKVERWVHDGRRVQCSHRACDVRDVVKRLERGLRA